MSEWQRQYDECVARRRRFAAAGNDYRERRESEVTAEQVARRHMAIRKINRETEEWQWWQKARASIPKMRNNRHTIHEIIKAVSETTGISVEMLTADTRRLKIATARHIAMYLAVEIAGRTCAEIGRGFGGRDPTTVRHALNKIESMAGKNAEVDTVIANTKRILESRRHLD